MTIADTRLEVRIHIASLALLAAVTPESRRKRQDELVTLVKSRSPEAVRFLERERGLA